MIGLKCFSALLNNGAAFPVVMLIFGIVFSVIVTAGCMSVVGVMAAITAGIYHNKNPENDCIVFHMSGCFCLFHCGEITHAILEAA